MLFSQIALLLAAASVFGIIAKYLKQPLIVGYLFAGIALSFFGVAGDAEILSGLSEIGVALLLFLLGLQMNFHDLASVGKVSLYTGLGQITFTVVIGFLLSLALGFPILPAAYIAAALTFSSTIVMVKLLSEKKDLGSLYGKISIGFLLVQDVVAILILLFLSGIARGDVSAMSFVYTLLKGGMLVGLVWILSRKALPKIFEKLAGRSQELLFIASIAWALGVASLVGGPLGFSFEIGGFLAGLSLSNMPEHLQIAAKARPLRDFFLTIFFLVLGTNLTLDAIGPIIVPSIILSLFVLVGNPIIVMSIMGLLGYKRRTSFLAGLTVAQISEFSLILVALGFSIGHIGQEVVSLLILVGIITMTISTYMITHADTVYGKVRKFLKVFERSNSSEKAYIKDRGMADHVILIGASRAGKGLIRFLKAKKIPVLVVDFSPKVFANLTADGVAVLFGDINDAEILDASGLENSRLVISTISNLSDNLKLLESLRSLRRRPPTIFTPTTRRDATRLYEKGATYVTIPQTMAGEHVRHIIKTYGMSKERLTKVGKGHFNRLIAS